MDSLVLGHRSTDNSLGGREALMASAGVTVTPRPDVRLLPADLAPRVIHALTSDLIACRASADVAAYIALRLPVPAREQIVLALFRHDLPAAMHLLRQVTI